MNELSKKIIAGVLVIMIALTSLLPAGLLPVREAQAAIAVVEVGANLAANVKSSVETTLLEIKEFILDELVWILINTVIQQLSASVINWINSGFEGSPAFVQDLKGHFQELENLAFAGLVNEIGATDLLCTSFKSRIQRTLEIQLAIAQGGGGAGSRFGKEALFRAGASCTLDKFLDNVGTTIEDFRDDFNKGGWGAWIEVVKPENNEYGAFLTINEELWRRQNEAKENRQEELRFGKGFLSWKKQICNDLDGDSVLNEATECHEEIQTPGTAIEDQLNRALGLPENRLLVADEINEILSALFSQLFQRVIGSSGGLFGASRPQGSRPSYTEQLISGQESINQGAVVLIERIRELISTVNEVIALKEARLEKVREAERIISEAISCDRRLESELADERSELEAIKQDEEADTSRARADIARLEDYIRRLEEAETASELEVVSRQFNRLFGSGQYELELATLQLDTDGVNERLNQIIAEAGRLLTACRLQIL